MDSQQIIHIISKKVTGNLSSNEKDILENWIAQSPENKKEFEAYSKLWEKSNELVLSDAIDVDTSLTYTKKQLRDLYTKKRWIIYLRQAAAVLLISLTLTFLYNYYIINRTPFEVPEQMVYQEIKAFYGTQTKVILADGTNVWLNSGSTLRFPTSFKNSDRRVVELNGEGFFDVTKNETKPFVVKTSKLDVKVYGTSFNILAYDDFMTMTVALIEGKVSLMKNNSNTESELIVLNPNEVVDYDVTNKKLYHFTDANVEKYSAWKDGHIVFYGDPIEAVIMRLEKWYNVKIIVKNDELKSYRFTATFIDESLEQVLKLLSLSSPMKYKITPARKLKDNSFTQREVTLSIKKL